MHACRLQMNYEYNYHSLYQAPIDAHNLSSRQIDK